MNNKDIFYTAKNYIDNYDLKNHAWSDFCAKANQEEFLASQEGFFYAVKAFPQMLCKLASLIDCSEIRLKVVENIWEEHGQGNAHAFHTNTFFQYLKSLGYKKEIHEIAHQPWVDEWVEKVMNKDLDAVHYSTYLAAIEYIYARISHLVCNQLSNYSLSCEQTHFEKHSVLDYEHANELLQVAVNLKSQEATDNMWDVFKDSVEDFLNLFNSMTMLTQCEAQEIANEKIAFYYSREDTEIGFKVVSGIQQKDPYNIKKPKVLMICSGGENAIELLKMKHSVEIVALDINLHQIQLAQQKIKSITDNERLDKNLLKFNEGKFEKIFTYLKNKLTYAELKQIADKNPRALAKLKYTCENIFSREILETVFTQEATRYSSQSFSDHFFKILVSQIKYCVEERPAYSNIGCVLSITPPIEYKSSFNKKSSIEYFHGGFEDFFKNNSEKFDMIDISNISDWMSQEKLKLIVDAVISRLNSKGFLIARKLLGDYNWQDVLPQDLKVTQVQDKTLFYSQTIIAQKIL